MRRANKDTKTMDLFASPMVSQKPVNNLFLYRGHLYMKCIPSQHLMRSHLLYGIIKAGGFLCVRLEDGKIMGLPRDVTIVPVTVGTLNY